MAEGEGDDRETGRKGGGGGVAWMESCMHKQPDQAD